MRLSRTMTIRFCVTLGILILLCFSHTQNLDATPTSETLAFAAFEAAARFGDQPAVHFLETFHDSEKRPVIHVFLVTKDGSSLPEDLESSIEHGTDLREQGESLIEAGRTEAGEKLLDMSEPILHQADQYGTLLISAEEAEPSLIAFHDGLPTYLVARTDAEERAEAFSDGTDVTLIGILYLSPLEYFYEFDAGGDRILVSPFHQRIMSGSDVDEVLQRTCEQPGEDLFGRAEIAPTAEFPESDIIPGVPDDNQRGSLPNSCGPTAGACLLGYWDDQGYDDFVEGTGTYDDVTRLIEELCDAMNWDPATGVYYNHIPIGLRQVVDDRGHRFGISNLYGIDSLDVVKQEIVDGRPFVYGSQENPWGCGHYVVTVGYNGNYIIVHDNWWSTPSDYFVRWDALRHTDDMMTTLVPEGQVGPASQTLPAAIGGGGGGCFIRAAGRG